MLISLLDQLFYTTVKVFYTNSQMICIFSKITKVFCVIICLQILAIKHSTMLKLIWQCKHLAIINRKNLVDAYLLLLAANLIIASFSNQSFY